MPELNAGFQSLPPEYQRVPELATVQTKGRTMTLEQALAFASETR